MSAFFATKTFVVIESTVGGWTPTHRVFEAGKVYNVALEQSAYMYFHLKNNILFRRIELPGSRYSTTHGFTSSHSHCYVVREDGSLQGDHHSSWFQANLEDYEYSPNPDGLYYETGRQIKKDGYTTQEYYLWSARQEGELTWDEEAKTAHGEWLISSPWGPERFMHGTAQEAWETMVELAEADKRPGRMMHPREFAKIPAWKKFSTTPFQGWKVVDFLASQGFHHFRDLEGQEDVFASPHRVQQIRDCWEPSPDGSRLRNWSELSDPDSVHHGRRYVTAYKFTNPRGYVNVVAFSSSPHQSGELRSLIGLGSYTDWKQFVEDDESEAQDGLRRWLQSNAVYFA